MKEEEETVPKGKTGRDSKRTKIATSEDKDAPARTTGLHRFS